VRLAVGDVLLIQGHRSDIDALRGGAELILLEEVTPHQPSLRPALGSMAVITGVVTLAALGIAPILVTAMAGCAVLVVSRILTVEQVYQAIDWKVIFLLAGVIPLGVALEQTGAAAVLADTMTSWLGPFGPYVLLSAFYVLTTLLTEAISNNAAAALFAPLAIAAAAALDVDPRPFLVAITFAASTSFMTPVGYQTNAMVLGPGGYRFTDFTRVGAPLNLLFWALATFLIPRFFPF
jgi:di/tricarboxylate transporter